jgi:hypothetical protein
MWLTPCSTAARRIATPVSLLTVRSRLSVSCIAPKPIRATRCLPRLPAPPGSNAVVPLRLLLLSLLTSRSRLKMA